MEHESSTVHVLIEFMLDIERNQTFKSFLFGFVLFVSLSHYLRSFRKIKVFYWLEFWKVFEVNLNIPLFGFWECW